MPRGAAGGAIADLGTERDQLSFKLSEGTLDTPSRASRSGPTRRESVRPIRRGLRSRARNTSAAPGGGRRAMTVAIQRSLWGTAPEDWAELAEPHSVPAYDAALDDLGAESGTRLLDVGCGSGLAA